jgi:hypothetical protein
MVDWNRLNEGYVTAEADVFEPPVGDHRFVLDEAKLNEEKGWLRWVGHFLDGEYADQRIAFFNSLDADKLLYLKKNLNVLGVQVGDLEQTLKNLNSVVRGTETVLQVKESGTINRKTGKPFINKSFVAGSTVRPIVTGNFIDYTDLQMAENPDLF